MMYQNTGIKILKKSAPMIVREEKFQKGPRRLKKFLPHGEKQTLVVLPHITQLPEQLEKGYLYAVPVCDVEHKNLSLITKITTSLSRLYGFVSHATKSVTKN